MVLIIHGLTTEDGNSFVYAAFEFHRISTIRKIRELIAVKPLTIREVEASFGLRRVAFSTIDINGGIIP